MKYYSRILLALVILGTWTVLDLGPFVSSAAGQRGGGGGGGRTEATTAEGQAQQGEGQNQGRRRGGRGRGGFGAQPGGDAAAGGQTQASGTAGGQAGGGFFGGGRGGRGRGRGGNENGGENAGGTQPGTERGARGPGSGPTPGAPAVTLDPKELARVTIAQNDRNGDGMLQADEQRALRGRGATADTDKNGVLTRDELEASFANMGTMPMGPGRGGPPGQDRPNPDEGDSQGERGRRGGRGRGGDRGGDENAGGERNPGGERGGDRNNEGNNNGGRNREPAVKSATDKEALIAKTLPSLMAEKSYRFKPSKDTLPKEGLPAWFASKDANRDGQVGMNEYSPKDKWTESLLSEFSRRDLNGDGMITPEEALKAR